MSETKMSDTVKTAEMSREEIIAKIDSLTADDDFRTEALEWLQQQFESGAYYPLTGRAELEGLLESNPQAAELFNLIGRLTPHELREVPDASEFIKLDQEYVGADGKVRRPIAKYIPKSMAPALAQMQDDYKDFLGKYKEAGDIGDYIGEHGRPGLIVLSGFRSDYYQFGVIVRDILTNGSEHAFKTAALPGSSQHGDPVNCAVDFTTIGDRDGRNTKPNGETVNFEDTIEFQWLLKNCTKYGFWLSYGPNPDDPMASIGFDGIVPESWHYQYLGSPEAAEESMHKRRVVEAFKARAQVLGNKIVSLN